MISCRLPWSLSQENRGFDFPTDWTPSIADNRHIPMSGLVKASMTRASFEGATDQSKAVDMGTIYLQRNIAKIRVVDAIAKNGDADHEITAVTLTGATNRGSFIPYMADNTAAWAGALPLWNMPLSRKLPGIRLHAFIHWLPFLIRMILNLLTRLP